MNHSEYQTSGQTTRPDMPPELAKRLDLHGEAISAVGTEWLLTIVRQGTWSTSEDGDHQVHSVAREGSHPVHLFGQLKGQVLQGYLFFGQLSHDGSYRQVPFTILPPTDRSSREETLDMLCDALEEEFFRSYQASGHPAVPESWQHLIKSYSNYLEVAKPDHPVAVFHTPRPQLDFGRLMSTEPAPWLLRTAFNLYVKGYQKLQQIKRQLNQKYRRQPAYA